MHNPHDSTSYPLQPPQQQPPRHQQQPGQVPPQGNLDARPTQVAPPQSDPGAGRLVAGRYRLLGKLGHGGMGTVWRA